jgi:hypothetical protein
MNRRLCGLVVATASLVACSSSNSGSPDSHDSGTKDVTQPSNDGASASDGTTLDGSNTEEASDLDAGTVSQTVGTSGGTVTAAGAVLTIPSGALPADTTITVQPNAGSIPSGYTALTPLFDFGPNGTTLQQPATVTFTLSSAGTKPTVYWANGSGGYDALTTTATTTATTTTASASTTKLGTAFVADLAVVPTDGAAEDAGSDAGQASDAAGATADASDATTAESDAGATDASDAMASAEGGEADAATDAAAAADAAAGDAGVTGFSLKIDNATVATEFAYSQSATVNGNSIWTITAATALGGVNWTVSIQVMGGAQQAVCQLGGYPNVTYTDYVNAAPVAVFSTANPGSNCSFSLYSTPMAQGQYAHGTFQATVTEAADAGGASHFLSGTYNVLY